MNRRAYIDAQSYLARRGHGPKTVELEPIKLSVKDLLKKEFNVTANLWGGAAKPNQQKGADFAAAERKLENMDRNSPEYKAELERRSKAAVDPALGTRGGEKIGTTQQSFIRIISSVKDDMDEYLDAKQGTPEYRAAIQARVQLIAAQRELGNFTKICKKSEVGKIEPSLVSAAAMIFQLSKIIE